MVQKTKQHFENNPFFIAGNGIALVFNMAQGIAVFLVVLSILSIFANALSPDTSPDTVQRQVDVVNTWDATDWVLVGVAAFVIGLALAMVSALLSGVSSYTSLHLARGEKVTIGDAFRVAFDRLWSYLWLQIIVFVKILLWSLLLIIPGIIMAVRYSLAGVAFFDDSKNVRGNAAIKESLKLTKNAWLTTFAASALFNLITLGAISSLVATGVNSVLYKQYEQAGDKKPSAHWLSWLALVLPFAIVSFAIMFAVSVAVVLEIIGK